MQKHRQRLYVNVDHVATLRQARRTTEPDPVEAARLCEVAGADGITAHLREDRRHIQDADIVRLAAEITTVFNLEMACTDEMLAVALDCSPFQVTFVPERREEITTEGGLDVSQHREWLTMALVTLKEAGIRSSLFIDPDPEIVARCAKLGADAIELHTGSYATAPADPLRIAALEGAAQVGAGHGLHVHAGHGLTVANVGLVAAIPEIEELNIGHSIVSRSVFLGLSAAVAEMRVAMNAARAST